MSDEVRVDPASLRRSGRALAELAGRLDGQWAGFSNRVLGLGDIFGDDPVGALIGASYRAAQQIAEQWIASVASALGGFGGALCRAADAYDLADLSVTERFHRVIE